MSLFGVPAQTRRISSGVNSVSSTASKPNSVERSPMASPRDSALCTTDRMTRTISRALVVSAPASPGSPPDSSPAVGKTAEL